MKFFQIIFDQPTLGAIFFGLGQRMVSHLAQGRKTRLETRQSKAWHLKTGPQNGKICLKTTFTYNVTLISE